MKKNEQPKGMKIKIDDELHIIVYIEYNNGIPHQVETTTFIDTADTPYWRSHWWDFFANNGEKTDLRAYNSGSGGDYKEIQAPQWVDGHIGKYWLSESAKFKGKPKNAKRLKHPVLLESYYMFDTKKTKNPFHAAEITNCEEYCEMCGYSSTEFCHEHKYDDDAGNVRWKHNDESSE